MSTWAISLSGLAAVLLLLTLVWIVSVVRRDASLVDRPCGSTPA